MLIRNKNNAVMQTGNNVFEVALVSFRKVVMHFVFNASVVPDIYIVIIYILKFSLA